MFRCKNGHESYKRQKCCTKCGEPLTEVQGSNTSIQYDNGVLDPPIIEITAGVVNSPPIQPNEQTISCPDTPLTSPRTDALEGVEDLLEGIRQRNRNESDFRKLLETVASDGIVSMNKRKQIEALKPTVSEEFYDYWLATYDICLPEYSFDVVCLLHWRTHGTLTAHSKHVFEFIVSGLEDTHAQLLLTVTDDDDFTWNCCFDSPSALSTKFNWKPLDHGSHLLSLRGSIETDSERIVVSDQEIHIEIEPDPTRTGTLINTGAMVNHGAKVKKPSKSKWSELPIGIKKREPKLIKTHVTEPPPIPFPEPALEVKDFAVTIIPAKGLSPRPYTIWCPNDNEVTVYFGERLVLGRYHDKMTIDPMEYRGINCYLPDGEYDDDSTTCISKESLLFEKAGNMVAIAIHDRGRSPALLNDVLVETGQIVNLPLGQRSKITLGAHCGYTSGQKPAVLSCHVVPGRELTLDLQDAFTPYDDARLVLNKQPGAVILTQYTGRKTLRIVWMIGAISLAELTGIDERAYENVLVFRHASRLWLQDTVNQPSKIRELSNGLLAELLSGFRVTQA
jgi:hypothetical protein